MSKFRFEDLEIWKDSIVMAGDLLKISTSLENKNLFRFSSQLHGVAMGICNNIAESTGTTMIGEQRQLLRFAKRECFEAANILVLLHQENLITSEIKENLFDRLDILSRRIQAYSNSLK